MRPIAAVLAVVVLSSVALVARGEEASVDEQITAILETEAVPTAEAAPTPAKEKAAEVAKPQAAPGKAAPCPMTTPMGEPRAIMAAVADPMVSGFMAVGKLREMAREEKTRQAAMGALESVAQESPEPAIRRAALFVLAEAFGAQGQGDRAAGCLARIGRSVSAPAPMPFSVPVPCPRCMGQAGPLAQGPCPMPPPPPAMTPPPAAPAPAPASDDALRHKRMEAQVLEAKVAQLQKVLVALQDKVKKTQADTDDQTRRAQMLQAQQTRLEALSRRLEQWQQRLKQSEEKVKQAQDQPRPQAEEDEDD